MKSGSSFLSYANYHKLFVLAGAVKIYAQNCLQAPAE